MRDRGQVSGVRDQKTDRQAREPAYLVWDLKPKMDYLAGLAGALAGAVVVLSRTECGPVERT